MSRSFQNGLARYFKPGEIERLAAASVGIAGVGGLGSNCAMLLARSGIGRLLLIDNDCVDASNLNRQHYWPRHLGQAKVEALAEQLLALNSDLDLVLVQEALDPEDPSKQLAGAPIWVEALDGAHMKRQFTEAALLAGKTVVAASGICGIGGEPMRRRQIGNLTVVGDFKTGVCDSPPFAPRVVQAAALMADYVLERILLSSGA